MRYFFCRFRGIRSKKKGPFACHTYRRFMYLLEMSFIDYPCGVCKKEVCVDDKAIQCEGECQFWYHCTCVSISDCEYDCLAASDRKWECSNCSSAGLPSLNSVEAIDVFHFDFQQNLPTPKLTVGQQFYLRLLYTYVFGIYSASTNVMMAYMWHELLAKRGANDVTSCLAHFIFRTALGRTGAKWSIWWADNCPGQNKNNSLMWFFQDLIRRNVYTRIDFKFLVVGHTYGPADRYFAVIEKHTSKLETVYTPQQWFDHVRKAATSPNCRIEVTEMPQSSFRDYRKHLRKQYTERTQDLDNKPLKFSNAVWFNFGRGEKLVDGKLIVLEHPNEVWVRHTYDANEAPQHVSYFKKRGVQRGFDGPPPPLYDNYPIAIKKAKADDLKKLVTHYVPVEYQGFYSELPTVDNTNSDDDT